MGYRSEVQLVLKKHDYDRLVELVCADNDVMRFYRTQEDFECYFWEDVYVDSEDYVHLYAGSIKWYGDAVDFVTDFLDGLEYEFVRYGEDPGDVAEENTFKGVENFLGTRSHKNITPEDVKSLIAMIGDIRGNIGRAIVHGELNGARTKDIVGNIMSDVQLCVIERWAQQFFPQAFKGIDPAESRFPDDEEFAAEYQAAGCPLE